MKSLILATIIVILILIAIFMVADRLRHIEYCQNWSDNLADKKAMLSERWLPDYDLYDLEYGQYSRECLF